MRLYDHLFTKADPSGTKDNEEYTSLLNPRSLETLTACRLEPGLATAPPGSRFQFERMGYFCVDTDSSDEENVFNRTVSLRDTWAKIEKNA